MPDEAILDGKYDVPPVMKEKVPQGVSQISSPNNLVLMIGRVLVGDNSDLPGAYRLSKQLRLSALT